MFQVRYQFDFEMAHKLDSAFSKACTDTIHGHSYKVEVFVESMILNDSGMVIDFGLLAKVCKGLQEMYDHATLLSQKTVARVLRRTGKLRRSDTKRANALFGKKLLICRYNPTAEQMAGAFFYYIKAKLAELDFCLVRSARLVSVRVHETDHGWAEHSA